MGGGNSMHICIVQNVSLTDHLGLSTYLRSISMHLPAQCDANISIIIQKGSKAIDDLPATVKVYEIDSDLYSLKGNIKYMVKLYKKLKEINLLQHIDIIHCLYPNSAVAGAVLFKRTSPKTKIIYDLRSPWIEMSITRGSIPTYMAPLYRKAAYFTEYILSKNVDGFIFITEGLKRFYEHKIKIDSKPFKIIPSGVDLDYLTKRDPQIIRNKYGIKSSDFLLGYVGVVSSMRELNFILKAFAKLTNQDRNYKLMFVGDGDDKANLEELAKALNVENYVFFTGNISYEEIPYYISAFDIGICHLPDKLVFMNSFPMKILEYLACRTPVLASNIEAHVEISKQNKNIHLYRDVPTFIDCLDSRKYDYDENIRSYGWNATCKNIADVWNNVLGK